MSTLKVNSIEASSGSEIDINSTLGTVPSIVVSNLNVTGVVTATSFSGSGANLTGVAATSNISTNAIVNSGITTVAAGSASIPSISPTGDTDTGIFFPSADTIAFGEGGSEAARIDSSGRLLLGTSSSRSPSVWSSPLLQVESTAFTTASISVINNQAADLTPAITIGKSRGTSTGSNTIVQNGDTVGVLNFQGADGNGLLRAAQIAAQIDGTPGSNDMPGRLTFSTTADSASTVTEAMRINNQRELLIGTTTRTANGGVLQVSNGITFPATQSACSDVNTLDDYEEGTYTPIDTSGAGLSFSSAGGFYTKIGRLVTCFFYVTFPSTANTSPASIGGLPFTTGNNVAGGVWTGAVAYNTYGSVALIGPSSVTSFNLGIPGGTDITNANMTLKNIRGSFSYYVA